MLTGLAIVLQPDRLRFEPALPRVDRGAAGRRDRPDKKYVPHRGCVATDLPLEGHLLRCGGEDDAAPTG